MTKISDEIRSFVKRSYEDEYMDPKELLALADRIDRETVELPKDADGEYIHIGDVMEWCDSGETLTVEGIGSDVLFYIDGENAEWTAARNKRHHVPDTWERIAEELDEWCNSVDVDGDACDKPRELADRIRKLRELDAIADSMDGGDE